MALIDRGDSEKEYQDRTEFIPMKSIGFMSREKPHPIDWDKLDINPECDWNDEVEIDFLRSCQFFHEGQKTDREDKRITLGKLREFFTEKSIKLFEKDGYIKLNLNFDEMRKEAGI